jgi:hypothetical protein
MIGAIVTAVKFISAFAAAVNTVKALKEGNLTKALISGVGAYFAFSGLGASTVGQAAAAEGASGVVDPTAAAKGTLGEGAATTAGTAAGAATDTTSVISEGMEAAADAGTAGAEGLLSAGGEAGAQQGLSAGTPTWGEVGDVPVRTDGGFLGSAAPQGEFLGGLGEQGTATLTDGTSTAYEAQLKQASGEAGLLSQLGSYAKENPELVKLGGQMLSGYARQKQAEELRREQLKIEEENRRRRGASASVSAGAFRF